MTELIPIYDASLLSESKVYHINGALYRFTGKCPWARIDHPKWTFKPLVGQGRSATLELNQNKVTRLVYEVPGMTANRKTEVVGQAIQQSLF